LHDKEVRVIDIQLYGLEEVLDSLLLRSMAIDQVFACTPEDDLAGDRDLAMFFEADWRLLLVAVIEDNCYTGFCNARLAAFVDEVLGRNWISCCRRTFLSTKGQLACMF